MVRTARFRESYATDRWVRLPGLSLSRQSMRGQLWLESRLGQSLPTCCCRELEPDGRCLLSESAGGPSRSPSCSGLHALWRAVAPKIRHRGSIILLGEAGGSEDEQEQSDWN